jgi:hypothetical protein
MLKTSSIRSSVVAAAMAGATPAFADNVATAVSVKTNAAAEQPGATRALAPGAGVVQDETIRTDQSGSAQLKFVDDTSLVVGPKSAVKLDKFVFDPNRSAKKFVLEATVGAFRFATGKSNHNAYEIRTPVATIGARGTQFAFGIEGDEVTIVVTQGTVRSCIAGTAVAPATRCVTARAGNTIVSTPAGAVVRRTLGAVPAVLRTVLTLPGPGNALPDMRDALRVQPLDRPVPGLNRAPPAQVDPSTASVPVTPNLSGGAPALGGGLPSLPSIGGGTPRVPGLGR